MMTIKVLLAFAVCFTIGFSIIRMDARYSKTKGPSPAAWVGIFLVIFVPAGLAMSMQLISMWICGELLILAGIYAGNPSPRF